MANPDRQALLAMSESLEEKIKETHGIIARLEQVVLPGNPAIDGARALLRTLLFSQANVREVVEALPRATPATPGQQSPPDSPDARQLSLPNVE